MPRLKRIMATFGDGYYYFRVNKLHVWEKYFTYQLDVDFDLSGANPGEYDAKDGISDVGGFLDNGCLQSCHTHNIPEILLLDEMPAAQVPRLRAGIPEIVGNRESPCVNLDLEFGRTTCGNILHVRNKAVQPMKR